MSKGPYKQQLAGQPPKGGASRKCPQCGKEFFPTAHWAYRNNKTVWCSWKCLRENEAGIPPHVQPEPEPERPLTDEQMARLAEIDAHEQKVAAEIPVVPAKEKREAAERERKERKPRPPFRSERSEHLARRSYEAIQEGAQAVKDLAAELGVRVHYVYTRAAKYREVYNLPALPERERQRRCGETIQIKTGKQIVNHSGEKTARLAAVMGRCRRLLDEIREEAGVSA